MPRFTMARVASTALGASWPGLRRSTNTAGEPHGSLSATRIGPSRANRSFNDWCIVVHPFHQRLCQGHQLPSADGVGMAVLHVGAVQYKRRPLLLRIGHELERAVRRQNQDRNDRVRGHVGDDLEFDVVSFSHFLSWSNGPPNSRCHQIQRVAKFKMLGKRTLRRGFHRIQPHAPKTDRAAAEITAAPPGRHRPTS